MSKLKDPAKIEQEISTLDYKKAKLQRELKDLFSEYASEFQARLNAKLKEKNEPQIVTKESLLFYAIYFDERDIIGFIEKHRYGFAIKNLYGYEEQDQIRHKIKINWIDEEGKRHQEANINAIELAFILKRHEYLKSLDYYKSHINLPIRYNDLETWLLIRQNNRISPKEMAEIFELASKYRADKFTDFILKKYTENPNARKYMSNDWKEIDFDSDLVFKIRAAYDHENPTLMLQLINYARVNKIELNPNLFLQVAKDAALKSDFMTLQICLENCINIHFCEKDISPTSIGIFKPHIIQAYNEYKKTDEYNLARAKAYINYLPTNADKLEKMQKLISLERLPFAWIDMWNVKIHNIEISLTEDTVSNFTLWASQTYPQLNIQPSTLVSKPMELFEVEEGKKQR